MAHHIEYHRREHTRLEWHWLRRVVHICSCEQFAHTCDNRILPRNILSVRKYLVELDRSFEPDIFLDECRIVERGGIEPCFVLSFTSMCRRLVKGYRQILTINFVHDSRAAKTYLSAQICDHLIISGRGRTSWPTCIFCPRINVHKLIFWLELCFLRHFCYIYFCCIDIKKWNLIMINF